MHYREMPTAGSLGQFLRTFSMADFSAVVTQRLYLYLTETAWTGRHLLPPIPDLSV